MNVPAWFSEDRMSGAIELAVTTREPDLVVARMPVTAGTKNPFGTVHAGAMIWFADVAATLCAVGDPGSVGEDGAGFPLAIDLHTVLLGNERDGELTARSTTIKRGNKLTVVRTVVIGATGRRLIEMTTTHLRAG